MICRDCGKNISDGDGGGYVVYASDGYLNLRTGSGENYSIITQIYN